MDPLTPPPPPNEPTPPAPPVPPAPPAQAQASPPAPADGGKSPEPDDSQLPPRAWLVRNGTYLLVFAALIVFLYTYFGLAGMWYILQAALGLSFVIFIHELGHFAVAKWCDVHVETFSIGFGPALPGCRWQWGETVYKIALFPLGGYVKMLGEGDAEEGQEDNPRSYKKKTVGQRMMIISAGVIMNVLLAIVCFTAVFLHGKERDAGVIGSIDPGGVAWQRGVPSGAVITQIGSRTASEYRPLYFTDLLSVVLGSYWNDKLPMKWEVYEPVGLPGPHPDKGEAQVEPRRDEDGGRPMIGVGPIQMLELLKEKTPGLDQPVFPGSSAAHARTVDLRHGDVVVAVTNPDTGAWQDLPKPVKVGEGDQSPLARLWYQAAGKPIKLRLQRPGVEGTVEVEAAPAVFKFGDRIVAATNPEKEGWPLDALPPDPRNRDSDRLDYFAFWRRMKLTAGQFLTLRVKRKDGEVDLTLPPAYTLTLGLKPVIGAVTAVRDGSTAQQMGVQPGDILKKVRLIEKGTSAAKEFTLSPPTDDPLRLPHEVQEWAYNHKDVEVTLIVLRDNQETNQERVDKELPAGKWDYSDRYRFSKEMPGSPSSSLSIPALGLAYRVETRAAAVEGPAAKAGLQPNDQVGRLTVKYRAGKDLKEDTRELKSDQWAGVFFSLQSLDERDVVLELKRTDDKKTPVKVTVTLEPDYTWPMAERGFILMKDTRLQRAANLLQAIQMGLEDTVNTVADVYYVLRGLVTGRLAASKTLGGPLTIGVVAYKYAGMGFWELVYFLALISANLAVINFLPVPFLDGGHMMFLLYEKVRGKPAPESVQAPLTYLGLFLLLLLMASVIVMDVLRIWF